MLPSQFRRYTSESQPQVIDPEVAKKIGLNQSIVIRQLHFWLQINEKAKRNLHDGKVWCYNSIQEWQESNFMYWSESTIKRVFKRLLDLGLIEVISNPVNKWEKVKWYTINYSKYALLFEQIDQVKLDQTNSSNWSNGVGQIDPLYNSITENTTENTTEKSKSSKKIENINLEEEKKEIKNNPNFCVLLNKAKSKGLDEKELEDEINLAIYAHTERKSTTSIFLFLNSWIENLKVRYKKGEILTKDKTSYVRGGEKFKGYGENNENQRLFNVCSYDYTKEYMKEPEIKAKGSQNEKKDIIDFIPEEIKLKIQRLKATKFSYY